MVAAPRPRPWLALALLGVLAAAVLLDAWLAVGWVLDSPLMVLGCVGAGYVAGAWLPPLVAAGAACVTAIALTVGNQRHEPGAYPVADDLVFFLLMLGAPAVGGAILTRRRHELAELATLRNRVAQRREADLRAARLEEQQRVEADCHRRLAEQLGGVALVAEGARRHSSPEEVSRALVQVEETARAALTELRRVVGTLRLPDAVPDTPAEEADPPGRPRASAADVGLAAAVGGAIAVELAVRDLGAAPPWAEVPAALLLAAPLVWRRRHPLPALLACLLLTIAVTAFLVPLTGAVTPLTLLLVTAYAAGAHVRAWPVGLALTWGGTLALAWASREHEDLASTAITTALSTLPFLAGRAATATARRARRMRAMLRELERSRHAEVREAIAATRLELARELHDTVAYSMTVSCLQASAARGRGGDPAAALDAILGAARDGMAELRAGLDEIDAWDGTLDATALDHLAERAALDVTWTIEPPTLPSGRAAALLRRLLRESFTNAARHAPGAPVAVRLASDGGMLDVEVLDAGSPEPGPGGGTGTGLAGLADAISSAGGTFSAGRRPGGGFRVAASLPLDARVPA